MKDYGLIGSGLCGFGIGYALVHVFANPEPNLKVIVVWLCLAIVGAWWRGVWKI